VAWYMMIACGVASGLSVYLFLNLSCLYMVKAKKRKKKRKLKCLASSHLRPWGCPRYDNRATYCLSFFFSQSNKFMDRKAVGRPKPILSMPTAEKQHWGTVGGVFFLS